MSQLGPLGSTASFSNSPCMASVHQNKLHDSSQLCNYRDKAAAKMRAAASEADGLLQSNLACMRMMLPQDA